MSREIKFRVWDDWKKKMITPVGIFWNDVTSALFNYCKEEGESRVALNGKHRNDGYHIMQYTGLKDKNGKEIYEGDIVKAFYKDCIEPYHKNVVIEIDPTEATRGYWEECEVIGNIYENKDLL